MSELKFKGVIKPVYAIGTLKSYNIPDSKTEYVIYAFSDVDMSKMDNKTKGKYSWNYVLRDTLFAYEKKTS